MTTELLKLAFILVCLNVITGGQLLGATPNAKPSDQRERREHQQQQCALDHDSVTIIGLHR